MVQVGVPVATLSESVPGHFQVTGAATIHEALADIAAADDTAYISSDGVWGGSRPYVTLKLSSLLRPHVQATHARYYVRVRLAGTGGFGLLPQVDLIDQVSRPWARTLASFAIPHDEASWAEFEVALSSAWLRGIDNGIRETQDLGIRIWAPGSVLSGTPSFDISVAAAEIEDIYPYSDVVAQWGVANLGGGLYGNVDYLGLVGAIDQVYTTEAQSSTPLTADTALQAAVHRAFYTLPPGTKIKIVTEPGVTSLCVNNKFAVQAGNQNGGGPLFAWAREYQAGVVGHNGPYRRVENLLIQSLDSSDAGRTQIGTPDIKMRHNNGQYIPFGFIGFQHCRFWKLNSVRAIESTYDEHNLLGDSLIGMYGCDHDGPYSGGSNGTNYQMGARFGYHAHDAMDCRYAWASEHSGIYTAAMRGPYSQQLRCRMEYSLAFNPNHPDAAAIAATGQTTGRCVNTNTQIVGRSNRCDASGAGPPANGHFLIEDGLTDGVTNAGAITLGSHLGPTIIRRQTFRNCGGPLILLWTSTAYNASAQFHGVQTNIGQFDGLATSPPFVDCQGTGRKPAGSWPGNIGVAYTNGKTIAEDCDFEQKAGSTSVPIKVSGCQKFILRRGDLTKLTKVPIIAVDEWQTHGSGPPGVYGFAWPGSGSCGPFQTQAFEFEGFGTNVAQSPLWSAATRAGGSQMGWGARDNPRKPQGAAIAIPLLNAAQLNALSIDNGPLPPGLWPPWDQPSEPSSGVWIENRAFFLGAKMPSTWAEPNIVYPALYPDELEEPVMKRSERYVHPPTLSVGGVGTAVNFNAPPMARSESYVRPPRLTTGGNQVLFSAPPMARSERYVRPPRLAVGQLTGTFSAPYQRRSERYAKAPYLQAVVPSVIEPIEQVVKPTTDVALIIDDSGADLRLEGGDLRRDHSLRTAILLSLFCDARVDPTEGVPDQLDLDAPATADLLADLRGWWSEPAFGSKLWKLRRAKLTPGAIESAREWVADSLSWITERGFAERVLVDVEVDREQGRLEIAVRIVRGSAKAGGSFWEEGLQEVVDESLALRVLFS